MIDPEINILKTANCKSTSGKSSLTYELGYTSDNSIHIRVTKNSGNGFFNSEWIKIEDIEKVLADGPEGRPLTSFLIAPLFQGGSSNSPGFVMAALTNERLLRVLKGKKRGYELLDPEGFNARMDKLVASKVKTGGSTGSTTKKSVRKTTSGAKKKAPRKATTGATKKAAIKKRALAKRKSVKTG